MSAQPEAAPIAVPQKLAVARASHRTPRAPWGSRLRRIGLQILLVSLAMVWLGPYLWTTMTSLKTLPEIVAAPAYPLPRSLNLDAYRAVFTTLPVGRYLINTVAMATAIAVLQIALALGRLDTAL